MTDAMAELFGRATIMDRDRRLFTLLFENRVMSMHQIHERIFSGRSLPVVSRRVSQLWINDFLERRFIDEKNCRVKSVYQNRPEALKEIADSYPYAITSPLCKSDSIRHDIVLVSLRERLQRLTTVTNYFTENMLQACGKFLEMEAARPFVHMNSDAALEITRQGEKFLIGLEFETSEKAQERYIRKLVSYYTNARTQVILYVCENPRIKAAVAQAEVQVIGKNSPRCHYALLSDVLASPGGCTFEDLKGAKIVLT